MKKKIIISLFLVFASFHSFPLVLANGPKNIYFGIIMPSNTEIQINEEKKSNTGSEPIIIFKEKTEETIQVANNTKGIRIISNHYSVDVNTETRLLFEGIMSLQYGSIHIKSNEEVNENQKIAIGDLVVSFSTGEFLAFLSEDKSQSIIKVIDGEIEVSNPNTEQSTKLEPQKATSTDEEGRLLIPFTIEIDENGWWKQKIYKQDFEKPPIADAGDTQRVLLNMTVTLNGSRSEFRTGDIFEWKLIKAPQDDQGKTIDKVAFNTINIVKPLFTPKTRGEYRFSLQITNEKNVKSNLSKVTIYVGKEYLKPVNIFSDVPEKHPNNLAITYLYKKNVMTGSKDPETGEIVFRPEDTINRVEILKTIFENLKESMPKKEEIEALQEDQLFSDVRPKHWFAPYVYLAKKKGIVKGNNGLYRPADEVLLGEAMKIIVEANKISIDAYKGVADIPYPDSEPGAWYNPYLFFVKKYELFDTDSDGNINPGKPITRAEFAEIMFRLDSRNLQEKKGFVTGFIKDKKTKEGIANAEVFVYETIADAGKAESSDGFVNKGNLFKKVEVDKKGFFTITIPVHAKYYFEGVTKNDVSANKVVIQVTEDEVKNIELLIETE